MRLGTPRTSGHRFLIPHPGFNTRFTTSPCPFLYEISSFSSLEGANISRLNPLEIYYHELLR